MGFFRHDLALTQKSTFDFRIRATKPMQYKCIKLLYALEILYGTFSLLNALLKKNSETFYRGCGMCAC